MITKERLEELIEQGATICNQYIDYNNNICYRFGKASIVQNNDEQHIELKINGTNTSVIMYDTKYLYETEEDARWELEMTATRTDTLKLANYTDFENENGDRVFYHKGTTYELSLWWASDNTKIIRVTWNGRDGFGWLFEKPLTKENYISACKLCLRLFKGEEV